MASSDPIQQQAMVQQLKGHQGAVLCLDYCNRSNSSCPASLLSGSEDGTARLWDFRGSSPIRASLCLRAPDDGEVLAVAFGPNTDTTMEEPSSTPWAREHTVYLATGTRVAAYDLRYATKPILTASDEYSDRLQAPDDVNQIAFCALSSGEYPSWLVTCDDGGSVRLCDTADANGATTVLQHDQDGTLAMVTSVAVQPNSRTTTIASGGTDCMIQLWRLTTGSRQRAQGQLSSSFHVPAQSTGVQPLCNPPMVHHLQWSPSGRLLAAACGDGTCCVFSQDDNGMELVARLEHEPGDSGCAAVASVVFPEWGASSPSSDNNGASTTQHDRFLITAGNDGVLQFWDLGSSIAGDQAENPALRLRRQAASPDTISSSLQGLSLDPSNNTTDRGNPYAMRSLVHGRKPNWIVSSRQDDPFFPSTLFVADTSNSITAYTIPY